MPKFNPRFVVSAAQCSQLPRAVGKEFCLLGRSNVGKSSFINHTLANKNLAKTSKTPGKTRLANMFSLNDTIVWVDLPGYGHARASRTEKNRWSRLIAEYCEQRENLAGVIWLLDIRHPGTKADVEAGGWLSELGIPILPVLTKGDKLTSGRQAKSIREYTDIFKFTHKPIVYTTAKSSSREAWWQVFMPWAEELMTEKADG